MCYSLTWLVPPFAPLSAHNFVLIVHDEARIRGASLLIPISLEATGDAAQFALD